MTSTARSIESLTTAQTSQDRVLDELLIRGGSPQQVGEDHHVDDHHGRHVENGQGSGGYKRPREGQPRAGAKGGGAPPHQLSRKLLRLLDRLGCFSFLSALASIWRMRSRVTENC